ncbi:MAG: isoprenyl transferase [Deltaproteobacteria bacterium]|jgi:undecaprenyl diphosphate synthase|nr:isoprenyl transferase [Deltaproteobacteria bacterium]
MAHPEIQPDRMPRHVAIIMDGNGRWAAARGLERIEGHRAGIESVRDVLRTCRDHGVEILTLYAFSIENWNRPRSEVAGLMQLLEEYLETEIEEVMRHDARVRSIGRLDRLPPSTRRAVEKAVARTADNKGMQLVFALSYGGRAEIVDAARRIARDAEEGKLDPEVLDEKAFAGFLYAPDLPDPDLLIRTGGEQRVSYFLLWQIAYSELCLSNKMWPDFRRADLEAAIVDYQHRERRFGLTSEQVRPGSEVAEPDSR